MRVAYRYDEKSELYSSKLLSACVVLLGWFSQSIMCLFAESIAKIHSNFYINIYLKSSIDEILSASKVREVEFRNNEKCIPHLNAEAYSQSWYSPVKVKLYYTLM